MGCAATALLASSRFSVRLIDFFSRSLAFLIEVILVTGSCWVCASSRYPSSSVEVFARSLARLSQRLIADRQNEAAIGTDTMLLPL